MKNDAVLHGWSGKASGEGDERVVAGEGEQGESIPGRGNTQGKRRVMESPGRVWSRSGMHRNSRGKRLEVLAAVSLEWSELVGGCRSDGLHRPSVPW